MTREEKTRTIGTITEKLNEADHFYIADTSGLTVSEMNKFRRACFDKGVEYRVVKNTLIKRALDNMDGDFSPFNEVLKGTSGIMFVKENPNVAAKIIKEFKKKDAQQRPKFKAASIDSELFIGESQLEVLAHMKSQEELVAEVVSLLQFPMKNMLSLLQSGEKNLAGIVKTLSEKK